jgi:hypothetical protein
MVHSCNPSSVGGIDRMIVLQDGASQKVHNPIWKVSKAKRVGGFQVVEHLPSKAKDLSSNPSTSKQERKWTGVEGTA